MIQFKPVTKRDGARLRRYYAACDYELSEYSLGGKLMWRDKYKSQWAEVAGCLVIRNEDDGHWVFDYPVALPGGDEDAALCAIEQECLSSGVQLWITVVPERKAAQLLSRYPYARVSNIRKWQDYLYDPRDLQLFSGRRYSGQRNHIKKFRAMCPNAVFRPLGKDDSPAIERFWRDFEAEFSKGDNAKAVRELTYSKRMLKLVDKPWFLSGGFFDGDKLIALTLAEKCGGTLIIHVEKALYSYTGVYPALVQEFASAFGEGCRIINREEDTGDKRLRMSKLQYAPVRLAPKYCFEPQNELLRHVAAIPELKTARLTLSAITEDDIPAYNALVLDETRNRWWGYDDVAGLKDPITPRSFYDVAARDFERRLAANFAVRLDGQLIGEAVLYNFDCRGSAELGCRVSAEYAGNGYGTEAFAAVAEWGLYQVHLSRVLAKCFKENGASYKMLSSCMRRVGEDDTYFYFEKLV
ncbi:MAG: GNAT family N-acetyltransferase [Oscillibacter sp.]|nr:GNAT family N-acetyltransferase [Oscillibacter sp.]